MALATNIDPGRERALNRLALAENIAESIPATVISVAVHGPDPYLLVSGDDADVTFALGKTPTYTAARDGKSAWWVWSVSGIDVMLPTAVRDRVPCDGFATGMPCLDCPACDERQGVVA